MDVKNPLDVTPMATDAAYGEIIRGILDDDAVDNVVAGIVPLTPAMQTLPEGRTPSESIESPGSIATLLTEIAHASDKPVIAVIDSGAWFDPLADRLESAGLSVFRSADRAVKALCRFVDMKLSQTTVDDLLGCQRFDGCRPKRVMIKIIGE